MRIVLTGFRGTGKTECGRLLAKLTGLPFYDTDTLIEQDSGHTIHEIFTELGEEAFRERERRVIANLPSSSCVVSTGGGSDMDLQTVAFLRRGSTLFLLEADEQTIEKRISHSTRPAPLGLGIDRQLRRP